MLYSGFRDAQRDIPDPPPAQSGSARPARARNCARFSGNCRVRRSGALSLLGRLRGAGSPAKSEPQQVTRRKSNFFQKLEYALHTNMTNIWCACASLNGFPLEFDDLRVGGRIQPCFQRGAPSVCCRMNKDVNVHLTQGCRFWPRACICNHGCLA